ncbi:major facilitator superfamily domain-containing protein [Lentinula edodes]|uniref:major facilitator superfamily domain-containing protein n=1 Tax=Lentinula edodes TaxID=5353 RepID=UPI001E8E13E2|nr:major facilitator superfamily domain-containing protein [Lentinula edodes]KAH7873917.1 major facilitator superfamily domain-containing protein [Lentinula edodes]
MAANRPQETNGIRLCRLVFSLFVYAQAGMSDGSLGAQLDSIQSHYDLTFSVVSLIFLANAAGWLLASFLNIYLLHYLDLWRTLILASISNIIGSAIIVSAPPFPVFVIALFFIGIGACIYDASFAAYTAHFDEGPAMSLLFAAFGFGALIAPLVVVAMLENDVPWNMYYYVPLGISILNAPLLWIIFGSYSSPKVENTQTSALKSFTLVIRNHNVVAGGILTALSMASGEIFTSWLVSFMTDIRHGNDAAMRYVLSGYWVGLILGRLLLAYATSRIGPWISLTIYGTFAIGFLAILQFVDNVPANAVAASLTGFFQAPSTPMIISLSSKWVPPSLIGPAISVLTAFGLVGSALGPLCIGFVNSAGGLRYLPGITMGAITITLGVWLLAPNAPWRRRIMVDPNQTLEMRPSELSQRQSPRK